MTLILSAIKRDFIVLSSDGAEFRHDVGKLPVLEVTTRRKIFPLDERSIAFAVQGQNIIALAPNGLDSQRLVGEIIRDHSEDLKKILSIEDIAKKIIDLLSTDVTHTFRLLKSAGIHQSPLAIGIYGFDLHGGRSKAYDVVWPMLDDNDNAMPQVVKLVDREPVSITHGGTGAPFVQAVIRDPDQNLSVDGLMEASIEQAQQYIREVYEKAFKLQPARSLSFAGDYFEFTITHEGLKMMRP